MVVLWELHSASGIPAHCAYQHVFPDMHLVCVVVGEAERFREEYPTESDAREEATHLLAHFLGNGWTDVTYRDPCIALP